MNDLNKARESAKTVLLEKYGETARLRIERGIDQVALLWKEVDGTAEEFVEFTGQYFVKDKVELENLLGRFEEVLEAVFGRFNEMQRELRSRCDLEMGSLLPVDHLFAGWSPGAHVIEDMFANKLAFIAALNFPFATLDEKTKEGHVWSRLVWAENRLAAIFSERIPADVLQKMRTVVSDCEHYIANYNIWMHHVLDEDGRRHFPKGKTFISHWNLRDEIKASYVLKDGLAKQKLVAKIMGKIITQEIPRDVINNPEADWHPFSDKVAICPGSEIEEGHEKQKRNSSSEREPDTRYEMLRQVFLAQQMLDRYSPANPSLFYHRFDRGREMSVERVEGILTEVVSSPLLGRIAGLIKKRLGRELNDFDIWYSGFKGKVTYPEEELDRLVMSRYPGKDSFERDLPNIIEKIGFSRDRAEYLASHIRVDSARGVGHAWGVDRRGDFPRLRTRFGKKGMDYKGFNIAIHELGHNVEQVFSLYDVDRHLLAGVPNTAFTEAIAFFFQSRDLKVLGLADDPKKEILEQNVLGELWSTFEISGVALLDIAVWRWMYDHPSTSAAQLREAVLNLAQFIWSSYFSQVLGVQSSYLLAAYSHMINLRMYLPDYPLGHLIAFQIEEYLRNATNVGAEIERMTKFGRMAPDLWMEHATGEKVSARPLLKKAEESLKNVLNKTCP